MARDTELRDALAEFAGKHGRHQTWLYTVGPVNEDEMTCTAQDEDGVDFLIRLAPILTSGQSLQLFPQEGTKLLASRLEDSEDWFLLWAEKYYKIIWTIGGCVLESDGVKWSIRNASASLLDVLSNLIDAVQPIAVLYGNNPDFGKLQQARTMLTELLQ